jgi:hypothetical protein
MYAMKRKLTDLTILADIERRTLLSACLSVCQSQFFFWGKQKEKGEEALLM